jgi:excisionase family DNA binding protein
MSKLSPNEVKPISVSVKRAANLIGVSTWSIREYIRLGRLPHARLGRRRMVVPMASLEQLVQDATKTL